MNEWAVTGFSFIGMCVTVYLAFRIWYKFALEDPHTRKLKRQERSKRQRLPNDLREAERKLLGWTMRGNGVQLDHLIREAADEIDRLWQELDEANGVLTVLKEEKESSASS